MKNRNRRNRRGIAIELALSMMVIVFSLCALMTTVVVFSRGQSNRANERFAVYAAADALGEQFIKGETPTGKDGLECHIDGNTLTVSKDGKVLLTVERNGTEVVRWEH